MTYEAAMIAELTRQLVLAGYIVKWEPPEIDTESGVELVVVAIREVGSPNTYRFLALDQIDALLAAKRFVGVSAIQTKEV